MENAKKEVISGYAAKLTRQAREDSFYHIKSSQDQDLNGTVQILDDMTQQSYSLLCPISLTHQEVPVRTASCQHVDTFDLGSCIKALSNVDLITCYSQLILKSKVDVPQICPMCKSKDKLYVDGIIETFVKFNPNVEWFKFTESGEAVKCDGASKPDHNGTIDLASPLPYCELNLTASSCTFFTSPLMECSPLEPPPPFECSPLEPPPPFQCSPLEPPPPFECSPLERSTKCSPLKFTFGPRKRFATKSPLLVGLGKKNTLPAPSNLNETIDIASPPPCITFSPLERSPAPSKLNEKIASPDKDDSSLLNGSSSTLVPQNFKDKEDPRTSAAMTKSGWESPNPFLYCRSPFYSELYNQATAFAFPDNGDECFDEAVFAAATQRRFSTVDLDSPRHIF